MSSLPWTPLRRFGIVRKKEEDRMMNVGDDDEEFVTSNNAPFQQGTAGSVGVGPPGAAARGVSLGGVYEDEVPNYTLEELDKSRGDQTKSTSGAQEEGEALEEISDFSLNRFQPLARIQIELTSCVVCKKQLQRPVCAPCGHSFSQ